MTRLIDADDIVLDYSGLANISPLDFRGTAEYFAKQIDAVPTVDALPVRHGKWLWLDGVRCSQCNYKLPITGLPSYCPNCGARMEEEKEE